MSRLVSTPLHDEPSQLLPEEDTDTEPILKSPPVKIRLMLYIILNLPSKISCLLYCDDDPPLDFYP